MPESVQSADYERAIELCDYAWTIIANTHAGNWDLAPDEWQVAARRWADLYHAELGRRQSDGGDV